MSWDYNNIGKGIDKIESCQCFFFYSDVKKYFSLMEKKRKDNLMEINSVSADLEYDRTEDLWYTIKKVVEQYMTAALNRVI